MKNTLLISFITFTCILTSGCGSKASELSVESDANIEDTAISDSIITPPSDNADATYSVEFVDNTPLISRDSLPYNGEEYSYNEISIIIPDSWNDKYLINESTDGTGFSIYQKASYELEEGLGFICSFTISDEPFYFINEGRTLAYTSNSKAYAVQFPSDVACAYEDEIIANEYFDMLSDTTMICYSLYIASDNVKYNADEYIIPMSEYCILDEDILMSMSYNDLLLAVKEIPARQGCPFEDDYFLSSFFDSKTWYSPSETYDEKCLTDIELENIKILNNVIKKKSADLPYCQKIEANESILADLDGDGTKETISLYDNGPQSGHDLYFYPVVTIDDDIYEVWDYEQFGVYMDDAADYCYVVDISPYEAGMEIAILDYGPSSDEVTHIFAMHDDSLIYIDTLPGFFFTPDTYLSGLDEYGGGITALERVDFPETNWAYSYYWYDYDNRCFTKYSSQFEYKFKRQHTLLSDIDIHLSPEDTSPVLHLNKGENIYIEATDANSWIKVKTSNNVHGYLFVERNDDYQLLDSASGLTMDEIFENLCYAD